MESRLEEADSNWAMEVSSRRNAKRRDLLAALRILSPLYATRLADRETHFSQVDPDTTHAIRQLATRLLNNDGTYADQAEDHLRFCGVPIEHPRLEGHLDVRPPTHHERLPARPTQTEIMRATVSETMTSSVDGYTGDDRAWIKGNARPSDVRAVRKRLDKSPDLLLSER